jgi:ABC-2 type transport system permease protein
MTGSSAVQDAVTVFVRQSLPTLRSPFALTFNMMQPVIFLALFGPLLGGVGMLGDASWQWFVPGVLVMLALFGTAGTGYGLLTEMQTGSHERLLVTPMSRSALLAGRTGKDVAELLVQGLIIMVVMLPFGFRLHPVGALLGLALLAALGLAMGALSHALAIACRAQQESFWMVHQLLLFPLLLLSGIMLPLDLGPGWMQTAGRLNPLTSVVEAMRSLMDGTIASVTVLRGTVAVAVLVVMGLWLGVRAMRSAQT